MSSITKATIGAVVVAIAAALVALFAFNGGSSSSASSVWHVGTTWKLHTSVKNGGLVAPDSNGKGYTDTWTMRVVSAPSSSTGSWVVTARLTGAEGPFAAGFRLSYVRTSTSPDVFTLRAIAFGNTPPQPLRLSKPLLGAGFPLQPVISGTPQASAMHPTTDPGMPPSVSLGSADTGGAADGLAAPHGTIKSQPLILPKGVKDVGPAALVRAEHAAQAKH